MSHVATVDLHVKDLKSLELAAKACGLELRVGQRTYKWFGQHVGDYPMPQGFKVQDLGKCDHAIVIPGNSNAYEIGVVKRRDGKPGYTLLWDFWNRGYGLQDLVDEECRKLKQEYAIAVATKNAQKKGFIVKRTVSKDGKRVRLQCRRK